uniref:CS domain-containing protein n=1 Tax=Trichuris muris TaxID=70415 RepID=A0A5S6QXK0_TRIMR
MANSCRCFGYGCMDCCTGPLGVKVDDDERTVQLTLVLPGAKKPRLFGLRKSTKVRVNFGDRFLHLVVRVNAKKEPKMYVYTVHQLPANILPSLCTYRLEDGLLRVTLRKAVPESWQSVLETVGLETKENEE